jgi:uncharacterized repeat protein (TIGR03843 family)
VIALGELTVLGRFAGASNHTLLATLGEPPVRVVYKPRAGERPLWDFPQGTLADREVAAHIVSEALGWDIVPLTVLRDGPHGTGSVQLFVPHDPARHYFTLLTEPQHHEALARIALFDLLVNNADRKASHVLEDGEGRLRGVDHGVCFHVEPKLRTVIWELGGSPIPEVWRADLRRFADAPPDGLGDRLDPLELAVLGERARRLAELEHLPSVPEQLRPYPWPPL